MSDHDCFGNVSPVCENAPTFAFWYRIPELGSAPRVTVCDEHLASELRVAFPCVVTIVPIEAFDTLPETE